MGGKSNLETHITWNPVFSGVVFFRSKYDRWYQWRTSRNSFVCVSQIFLRKNSFHKITDQEINQSQIYSLSYGVSFIIRKSLISKWMLNKSVTMRHSKLYCHCLPVKMLTEWNNLYFQQEFLIKAERKMTFLSLYLWTAFEKERIH